MSDDNRNFIYKNDRAYNYRLSKKNIKKEGYKMKDMSYFETIQAIADVKKVFEKQLEKRLYLTKVQSPLFVKKDSGLQDSLTGVEKGVKFSKGKEML